MQKPHAGQPAGRLSAGSQPPLPTTYDVFSVNSVVSQVQDMFRKKIWGVLFRRRPRASGQPLKVQPSDGIQPEAGSGVLASPDQTSLFHRGFDHTLAFIHADGIIRQTNLCSVMKWFRYR